MSNRIVSEFNSFESAELAARRILNYSHAVSRLSIYPRRDSAKQDSWAENRASVVPAPAASADFPVAGIELPGRVETGDGYGYYEPGEARGMLLTAEIDDGEIKDITRILLGAGGMNIDSQPLQS